MHVITMIIVIASITRSKINPIIKINKINYTVDWNWKKYV